MTVQSKSYPQKILKGDRISVPKDILRELDLKVGDWVLVACDGQELKMVPAEVHPRD